MKTSSTSTAPAAGVLVLVILGACASENEQCEARTGTYQVRWFEQTGGCGPIPDQVVTVDEMTTIGAECSGRAENSADNCEVTIVDLACPEPGIGAGVTSTANAKVSWATDGEQGDGLFNLVVRDVDGIVLCQSSYDVEYDRL